MLRHLPRSLKCSTARPAFSAYRTITTSVPRLQTLEDPSRPGLYYHLLPSSPRPSFAISLLPSPPASPRSPTILGFLPAETAETSSEGEGLGLNDFQDNPAFLELLHETVQAAVAGDEFMKAEAVQRGEGWMHINDARNPPALNRTPEPDDIIGSVRVEDGQILAQTYERMPTYRVCTTNGVTQLADGLAEKLLDALRQADAREHAS